VTIRKTLKNPEVKMKALPSLFLALLVAGVLTVVVSAQPNPVPVAPVAPPAPRAVPVPNPQPFAQFFGNDGHAWHLQQMKSQSQAAELVQQLVKTNNDDEKGKIREKLTEVLNQVFDEHIQQQQKELEELEKQIANLRTLMKKRTAAKNDIVERRIEQMIEDAKGLGWSTPGSPHFTFNPDAFQFKYPPGTPAPATPKVATQKKKSEDSKRKDRKKSDDDDDEKGKDRKKSDDDNDNDKE
jgi:hypothetical protein